MVHFEHPPPQVHFFERLSQLFKDGSTNKAFITRLKSVSASQEFYNAVESFALDWETTLYWLTDPDAEGEYDWFVNENLSVWIWICMFVYELL